MSTPGSWVDRIGASTIHALAKSEGVALSPPLLSLLEKYGDLVSSTSQRAVTQARRATRARQELRQTHEMVQREVEELSASLPAAVREDVSELRLETDVETRLPRVIVRVGRGPRATVHVERGYARVGRGCTFGVRGNGGNVENYCRAVCAKRNWEMGVGEFVGMWVKAAGGVGTRKRGRAGVGKRGG